MTGLPMSSATAALQQAIYAALSGDAALRAALGADDRIHDHAPRGAAFPYVAFASFSARDWSTGDTEGEEHTLVLHVWSREQGMRETETIAAAIRAVLHDAALALDGHRLVNLRHVATEIRREPDGLATRGIIRLRAVTEPA
ncbi:MAG: DUF3168 domain-containing protein [Hyphomicrobiales bacterium]|nr:MAG: DUF3168 domain-containing protein [Hyphomicrobiales bacterium]